MITRIIREKLSKEGGVFYPDIFIAIGEDKDHKKFVHLKSLVEFRDAGRNYMMHVRFVYGGYNKLNIHEMEQILKSFKQNCNRLKSKAVPPREDDKVECYEIVE